MTEGVSDSLIINADDFGITRAVSDAVIEVNLNGSVTSASLMATMPAAAYAADLARANPSLGVGLHFALTEGFSALGGSSPLTASSDGRFFTRNALVVKIVSGIITTADLRSELAAQFARLESLGVRPTHIDSHQHVHAFPPIFTVVTEFAAEKKVPVGIPYTQAVRRPQGALGGRFLYREATHLLLASLLRRCDAHKRTLSNRSFNSVFDVYPFQDPTAQDYRLLIESRSSSPHELMVHPYVVSEDLRDVYTDPAWYRRKSRFFSTGEAEYRALRSFSIRDWIAEAGLPLRLITYRELAA